MSLGGLMPFQFSPIMEMVLDNDAPKTVRDMAEIGADKKAKDLVTQMMEWLVEESYGKAFKDIIFKVKDRTEDNTARTKDGKKKINYQETATVKKDMDTFFDQLFEDMFKTKSRAKKAEKAAKNKKEGKSVQKKETILPKETKNIIDQMEDFFGKWF